MTAALRDAKRHSLEIPEGAKMDYLWIKAFHIVFVLLWIGGMLSVALTLRSIEGRGYLPADDAVIAYVRKWDRRVTSPAMLAVWAFGLTLASKGEWFPQGWLITKLVFVFVLSALHGLLSGRLRKLSAQRTTEAMSTPVVAIPCVVGLTAVIVVLVVVKPF